MNRDTPAATIDPTTASPGRDAWGNFSKDDQCSCIRDGSRTTYFLCDGKAKGIIVTQDGRIKRACARHLAGARRTRVFSANFDPKALYDLDGNLTHFIDYNGPHTVRGNFVEVR